MIRNKISKFNFFFIIMLIFSFSSLNSFIIECNSHAQESDSNGMTIENNDSKNIDSDENKDESSKQKDEEKTKIEKQKPLISNPPKKLSKNKSKQKKSKKKSKNKSKLEPATILTDGAAIYKLPNFDSQVIDYGKMGSKVFANKKVFEGIGGFGAFYKIKLQNGKYGYIADVDLSMGYKKSNGKLKAKESRAEDEMPSPLNPLPDENGLDEPKPPIFFSKYIGASVGIVNFTEKFSGQRLASQDFLFGLRMLGPGVLLEGLPLDVSLLLHSGIPKYYTEILGASEAKGFYLMGDILLPYPFLETDEMMISWGLGINLTYTKFTVPIKNSTFDSQELRVGAVAGAGISYRINQFMLRGELKYYYEKSAYIGYFFNVLSRF